MIPPTAQPPEERGSVPLLIGLVPPVCLFAWRFLAVRGWEVWRDWSAILCCFWILLVLRGRGKTWGAVLFCAYLLGLYFWGQAGHALQIWRRPYP